MTDSQKYTRVDTFDPDEHLQPLNEESEVNYLPCYRFSNRGSFVLWRLARTIWLDCLAILIVLLPMVVFHINTEVGALFMVFFIFPIISFVVFLFYYNSFQYIQEKIPVGSEVMLYAEIIKYKPSSDPKTWTIIGNHMSKTFIEENQSYSLFNEQDYFDLFRYLTRSKNEFSRSNNVFSRSNNVFSRSNNGFNVHITTNPTSNVSEANKMPNSIPNLDEANGVSVETASKKPDNETVDNNTGSETANNNVDNGVHNNNGTNETSINRNLTTARNIIPDTRDGALGFLLEARSQAIQSFDESDARYWSTLYPDFAK